MSARRDARSSRKRRLLVRLLISPIKSARKKMKQIFPQFKIRTMFCIVFLFATSFFVVIQSWRLHNAAKLVQAAGGDVWCAGYRYPDVVDFDGSHGAVCKVLLQRAMVTSRILMGTRTQLWLNAIMQDDNNITCAIVALNPEVMHFEVLGPNDFTRMRHLFPSVEISSACGLARRENAKNRDTKTHVSHIARDRVHRFRAAEAMLSEDPQQMYRIDRYETIIGYHEDGAMGSLRDKHTGRVTILPWPQ